MNYAYLFDVAWVFLGGWIFVLLFVLLTVGLSAFGKDITVLSRERTSPGNRH